MKNFTCIRLMLVVCFWALAPEAWGQEQSKYQPNKVIPPSPTAASLGVYGEISVGYYSGTPDISIPLHEIKTAAHSLPVRMQYNASGIRVSENASWVGLGWALSAGGVITRTIRGLDDFDSEGYYFAKALPPARDYGFDSPNWVSERQYFEAIKAGRRDGEPDIFTYNFGTYSGKLVLGKRADGSQIFMSERNNLKVEYLPDGYSWKITDANGYTYYFGTSESVSEDYTYFSEGKEIEPNAPLSQFDYRPGMSSTTAWYVDSIVAPTSESIRFFYARRGHSFGLVSKSEKAFDMLNLVALTVTGNCRNSSPRFDNVHRFYQATKPTVFDIYLDSIAYLNGSIKFKTSDRQDIEYPSINTGKPGKLSEIIIRDMAGKRVKKYVLHHSYFNNDSSPGGRLKLDAITELGSTDQEAKPPYLFSYFYPNNLASKIFAVNAIDHWGFYNGANNKTLLPAKIARYGTGQKHLPGADRNPGDAETLKTGTLASITYPTGGSTHFDYEPHDFANLHEDDRFRMVPAGVNVYAAPSNIYPESNESEILEIADTTAVTFNWSYEKVDPYGADLLNVETIYGEVRNMDTRQVAVDFSSVDLCPDGSGGNCPVSSGSTTKVLLRGRYLMYIRNIQGYITRANASWETKDTLTQRQGGGIRVKSIVNRENGKPVKVRRFYYTDDEKPGGKSVGKLISPLIYDYRFNMEREQWSCIYKADYMARMSNSLFPVGLSSKGTVVGYDKVTEVIGEHGEGGKNVYYFHNAEDQFPNKPFPGMPTYSYPLAGKMAVMATFDSAGTLLRKVDYIYRTKETAVLKGVKLYEEPKFNPNPSLAIYFVSYYDSQSSWNVLAAEEERLYSPGNQVMLTVKKYHYGNSDHKEVTREETLSSDGSMIIKKYRYPGDFPGAGSTAFVSQLVQRHIIAPVIEEQTLLRKAGTTRLLSGSFTEYRLFQGKFLKPGLIYRSEGSQLLPDTIGTRIFAGNKLKMPAAYRPEIYFDDYNPLGNMVQYHRAGDDHHQTYLWGYHQSLPVAEVKNARPAQVFYTGFEEDGTAADAGNPARTGRMYLNKGTYDIPFAPPDDGRNYRMSYWYYDNGRWHFSGDMPFHSVISKGSRLDEVRVFAADAQMTTYTYDPLAGLRSVTDVNNMTTYYDYDGLSRLHLVKDEKGNILRQFDYQYAGEN